MTPAAGPDTPPARSLALLRALASLEVVYTVLDNEIAMLLEAAALRHAQDGGPELVEGAAGGACRACGRCCTFPPGAPVLYASALERAYLARTATGASPSGGSACCDGGACPFLDTSSGRCAARARRAVGCRTYFCEEALPDVEARRTAQALSERALAEARRITDEHGLEWDYAPAVERLRRTASGTTDEHR